MLLYSTNPLIKFIVQQNWFNDCHYLWCSRHFDCASAPTNSLARLTGATSDPFQLYQQWRAVVARSDRHSDMLQRVKTGLIQRAADCLASGNITAQAHDDIVVMASRDDFAMYKPQIYVIPTASLDPARIHLVPMADRASYGEEFIIKDLRGAEFEIVEGL